MNYFRCTVGGSGKGNTVTVTCAEEFAGLTITLSKTGKTYTKTCPSTAPYVVTFYGVENGDYTVSATYDGRTYSEFVVVKNIDCVLNYGFGWITWVNTAQYLDASDYASLDELLEDEAAIRELFLEHACVDYMAEAPASNNALQTIINNDLCAKWINLSDYALDYLYANEVIADLMDEADKYFYGEWALMPQVPTMTSNTAPYGEAISSTPTTSAYDAYHAFNGVDTLSDMYASNTYSTDDNAYVGYSFVNPIIVKNIKFKVKFVNGGGTETFIIEGSNDKSDWIAVTSEKQLTVTAKDTLYDVIMTSSNGTAYKHYRVRRVAFTGNNERLWLNALQFYAWAPKGNVPVMTANNAPYGTASASSIASGYEAYKAFDGNVSTALDAWISTNNVALPQWIYYKFTNPTKITKFLLQNRLTSTTEGVSQGDVTAVKNFKIQGSNDGTTWVDLGTFENPSGVGGAIYTDSVNNSDYYLYCRLYATSQYSGNYTRVVIQRLQFYGRELKVSVPTMTSNTAPYGEASASSTLSGYDAYKAFQEDTANNPSWIANTAAAGAWLQYKFTSRVFIKKAYIRLNDGGNGVRWPSYVKIYKIVGSTATEVSTFNPDRTAATVYMVDVGTECDGIKYEFGATSQGVQVFYANFYGLDYSEKEFEVGTTKKWLYDHGVELETFSKYKGSTTSSDLATTDESELYFVTLAGTNSSLSNFSIAGVTVDLSDYSLLRAKIGSRAVAAGNPANYLDMDIWKTTGIPSSGTYSDSNIDAYVAPTSITEPNTISLSVSSYSEQKFVSVGTLYANGKKISIEEFWLE